MNERIQELAEQAGGFKCSLDEWGFYNEAIGKFAELIVQECIREIETYQIPVGNSAASEMACEWTYDALKEIRANIKKHFGVE